MIDEDEYEDAMAARLIGDLAREEIERMERAGSICEAIGLSPAVGRYDPAKCKCGGGCESLLECWFWYWLRKTPNCEIGANRQVKIGRYRVDCLIDCAGARVVVELDGKRFHDKQADSRRDCELIKEVDAIVRIPGSAMHYYPEAVFEVLGAWFPRFKRNGTDIFCCHVDEFASEMASCVHGEGDYPTEAAFLEYAQPNFELWNVDGSVAWVGSPRAWLNKWRVAVPTLTLKQ